MANQYPGEIIDGIGSGLTGAVKSVLSSVSGGIQGAGEQVQSAVDRPFRAMGVRASPLRIIDHPLKGVVSAVENIVDNGAIRSVEMLAHGVTSGVDEIPKTLLSLGEGKGLRMPEFPMVRR